MVTAIPSHVKHPLVRQTELDRAAWAEADKACVLGRSDCAAQSIIGRMLRGYFVDRQHIGSPLYRTRRDAHSNSRSQRI
jgi:hypothetical protein